MTARGRKPARGTRPQPDGAQPEQPAADAAPAATSFVPLAGLAMAAPATGPEQLRTGLRSLSARPKLLVGAAGDPAELEADALADAVVHRMLQPSPGGDAAEGGGTDGNPPAARVLGALRRTPASRPAPTPAQPATDQPMGLAGGEVDTGTEQALRAASTAGRPLAPALRRQYEDAFGADFGSVRVHSGPASAQLNAALGARAFTLGRDIYFGDRVPGTASTADRHLMAHELAHTLQDGATGHRAVLRRLAVQITPSWIEAETDTEDPTGSDSLSTDVEMPLGTEPAEVRAPVEAKLDDEDFDMLGTASATTVPGTPVRDTPRLGDELKDAPSSALGEVSGPSGAPGPSGASRLELCIEELAIVGRPDRLFSGSMGDHMTAFVITRKGVENAVAGQPFTVAVRELKEMAEEMKLLPGWGLVDALQPPPVVEAPTTEDTLMEEKSPGVPTGGAVAVTATTTTEAQGSTATAQPGASQSKGARRRASHHARFVSARQHLQHCEALLDGAGTDDLKIVRLQNYIAAYLELRELVPLSVANWKGANRSRGGKGDGESGLPGFLADPEKPRPPGQLRRDFLSSIATYRIAQAAVEPNAEALAVLMPGLDPALSADERAELMVTQHVQSVLTNFPQNFEPLADDILWSEGETRKRAAEEAESKVVREPGKSAKKDEVPTGEASTAKSSAKRKASALTEVEPDEDFEEHKEAEQPARQPEETFGIIRDHLMRLVRMRYAEAATEELKHQHKAIEQHERNEDHEAALIAHRDAAALTNFLTKKGSGAASSPDVESKAPKRDRGNDSDAVDDLYGTLTPLEAKPIYTGRDTYKGTRKKASGADLAVQVVLTDTGDVQRILVERAGKHTKGAHTVPWMQWVIWLSKDIRGKDPATALTTFTTKTVPAVRRILAGGSATEPATGSVTVPVTVPVPSSAMDTTEEAKEEAKEEPKKVEEEALDVMPSGTLPLIELQEAIAAMLEEISEAPDSAVLDATDTGGKGEAHYRVELEAYQKGERDYLTPEDLLGYLLALCDVGEADTDLAERTVVRVLEGAKQDYPKAYDASGIAAYEVSDLADRASHGKSGVYEYEEDSDEDEQPKKRQKKKTKKPVGGK